MFTGGVVVGRVIEVKPHPRGDRDRLAYVDLGNGDKVQIVFGGLDVVHDGSLVPVALPGARLPARRKKMRTLRFRGELSQGMFCSLVELGWALRCPDEVALFSEDVDPGDRLDRVSVAQRRKIVINKPVAGQPIIWPSDAESFTGPLEHVTVIRTPPRGIPMVPHLH